MNKETKFRHYRNAEFHETASGSRTVISPRGGATVAYRLAPDGTFAVGVAYCHPNDNFNFQSGRAKADGRIDQLAAHDFNAVKLAEKYGGDKHMLVMAADEKELVAHMDKLMVREAGYVRPYHKKD